MFKRIFASAVVLAMCGFALNSVPSQAAKPGAERSSSAAGDLGDLAANPYNYTYIYFGPYESHEVARVVADRECARLGGTGSGANYYPDGKLNRGPGWYADVTIRNPQR